MVSYTAVNPQGEKQNYSVWSYQKQFMGKEAKYTSRVMSAGDSARFADGTRIYFSGKQVSVNGSKQDLESINYILEDGVLESGFIRTFD